MSHVHRHRTLARRLALSYEPLGVVRQEETADAVPRAWSLGAAGGSASKKNSSDFSSLGWLLRSSEPYKSHETSPVEEGSSCYGAIPEYLAKAATRMPSRHKFPNLFAKITLEVAEDIDSKFDRFAAMPDGAASGRQDELMPIWTVDTYPLGLNLHCVHRHSDFAPATAGFQLHHALDGDGCAAVSQVARHTAMGLLDPVRGLRTRVA